MIGTRCVKQNNKIIYESIKGGPRQKISVGLKVLYTIEFFCFYFDNSVKQQINNV
jgi:hypothetical protein